MSDLSRLLEDVYGDGDGAGAALPAPPEWSSDEALEDTFASWVPGPPADAPAAERAFAMDDEPAPEPPTFEDVFAAFAPDDASDLQEGDDTDAVTVAEIPDDDDVFEVADLAGLTESFAPDVEHHEPVAVVLPAPPMVTRWTPSDDDILPRKGAGGRRRSAKVATPATGSHLAPELAPATARSRFQRSRAASSVAVEPTPAVEVAGTPADEPVVDATRGRGRRPAPKHARRKSTFQLTRRATTSADGDVAASKRRSFRLR